MSQEKRQAKLADEQEQTSPIKPTPRGGGHGREDDGDQSNPPPPHPN